MARYDHLPIWKTALDLALAVERAVAHFPRSHKYALGTDLRRSAQRICELVVRANADEARRADTLDDLISTVEETKTLTTLGKELRAFHDFNQFARIAELAVSLGKQSGGSRRQCRSTGQRPDQRRSQKPPPESDGARA